MVVVVSLNIGTAAIARTINELGSKLNSLTAQPKLKYKSSIGDLALGDFVL